ncbi:hypothetical protein KC357_g131 [Hortaea werneckii]|nr:hypothetical protein KC357_g131 [Hortaea werneckii]
MFFGNIKAIYHAYNYWDAIMRRILRISSLREGRGERRGEGGLLFVRKLSFDWALYLQLTSVHVLQTAQIVGWSTLAPEELAQRGRLLSSTTLLPPAATSNDHSNSDEVGFALSKYCIHAECRTS